MAKYRLLKAHTYRDYVLDKGTEVGDDTPYPWVFEDGEEMRPSLNMEGVDEEGVAKVNEYRASKGKKALKPPAASAVYGPLTAPVSRVEAPHQTMRRATMPRKE